MENISKALTMAASTLLGVMILIVIIYFFNNISSWPREQDEMQKAEQIAKFNQEYEVYNKKGMYGVDVISCLNKAKSNDEKYVEGGRFLSGDTYGTPYLIDVSVMIKTELEESVEIFYIDSDGREKELFNNDNITIKNDKGVVKYGGYKEDGYTVFKFPTGCITHLNENDPLKKCSNKLTSEFATNTKYYLLKNQKVDTTSVLYKLLNQTNDIRQVIKNNGTNLGKIVKSSGTSTITEYVCSKAIWNTALYDFKKKRFKCEKVDYSEETGRITALHFVEL